MMTRYGKIIRKGQVMKVKTWLHKWEDCTAVSTTLPGDILVITRSDGKRLSRNERVKHFNHVNKSIAESRPSYCLKKWFLGLRWVNNWLWRRKCETKPLHPWMTEDCIHYYQNPFAILPDYPSINELSTERKEDE